MGWLSMQLAGMDGHTSPKNYLDSQFTYEHPGTGDEAPHGCQVIESACHDNRVYYAAVTRYLGDGTSEVHAVICLVRWNPRAADGFVFAYKDLCETMGPSEAGCPLRILERLSPTDNPYAMDWRRRCYETIRRRARKLPDGALIRFSQPIAFSDNTSHETMRVCRKGTRIILTSTDGTGRYRIPNLLDRKFEIVRERKVAPVIFT